MILAHTHAINHSRAELFELSLTAKTQVMRNLYTNMYCEAVKEELKKAVAATTA